MADDGNKNPAKGQNEQQGRYDPPGEFAVEVCAPRNQAWMFPPTKGVQGEALRGRWRRDQLTNEGEMVNDILRVGDIPGIHISVDCRRKRARIWDGLSDLRSEELAALSRRVAGTQVGRGLNPSGKEQLIKPWPEVVKEDMTDGDLKTWCFWIRKALDVNEEHNEQGALVSGPVVRAIRGEVPSLEEIGRMPGKTEIQQFNSSADKARYQEDQKAHTERIYRARSVA